MNKKDEKILVVKRNVLFAENTLQGFLPCTSFDDYEKFIAQHKEFLVRSLMEEDPDYKQIIPYLVFSHNNTYFLMRRSNTAGEARLKNKHSLGIGGHLRIEDVTNSSMIDWAMREFNEEINYDTNFSVQPLGLINDESNPVGQVHTGFVFLISGNHPNISVKSELKEGSLVTLEQMSPLYESMETWSQLVYNYLLAVKQVSHTVITQVDTTL